MSAINPDVTIAINSYKSPDLIRNCLRSIEKQLPGSGVVYEILVADSETDQPTESLMREEFPCVRFLPHPDNVGYGGLVNASIEAARGEFVFLINADVMIGGDSLSTLLAYAREHPEAGIIGPRQFGATGDLLPTAFRFYRPMTIVYRRTPLGRLPVGRRHVRRFELESAQSAKAPVPVDWLMGSALFVSQRHAATIGPMDRRFFMYFEDVDWSRRAWEKGLRVIYHPRAVVGHLHKRQSAKGGVLASLLFNRLTHHHLASAAKYFWKYRNKRQPEVR